MTALVALGACSPEELGWTGDGEEDDEDGGIRWLKFPERRVGRADGVGGSGTVGSGVGSGGDSGRRGRQGGGYDGSGFGGMQVDEEIRVSQSSPVDITRPDTA